MFRILLSGVFAFATATSLATSAKAQSATVTNDWFDYSIRWTRGAPTYSAKWYVLVSGGILQVCGAGAHSGGVRSDNMAILSRLGFFVGDELVMTDMSFFSQVKRRRDLSGANAKCVSTGKRASDYTSTSVSLQSVDPNKTYRKGS